MAPIKFEENMKDKLEKRTIQPSSEAWSKLSDRLNEDESSKKSNGFWWIGLAASIALLIFSSILFFGKGENKALPEVVKTEVNPETPVKEAVVLEAVDETEDTVNEQMAEKEAQKPKVNTTPQPKHKQQDVVRPIAHEQLANVELKDDAQKTETKITELKKNELSFEAQKVQDVLAEIKTLNEDGTKVTDREIDSLLNLAQKELLTNKIFKENSKTVDADALLQDVEQELEQSFRTKVFEALRNSYGSVKTAVAERNN